MQLRWDAHIELSLIGLVRAFSQILTESKIIVDSLMKFHLHVTQFLAFERHKVFYAFDFSEENLILGTVFNFCIIAFVF